MNDAVTRQLHDLICEFATLYCLSQNEVLSFLSLTLTGTMAQKGYSDEFAKKTFEKMYSNFLKKKQEFSTGQYEEMPGDVTEQVIKAFKKLNEEE